MIAAAVAALTLPAASLRASLAVPPPSRASDDFISVARTLEASLNDLVRGLPLGSPGQERALAGLSALQEGMLVHERRMRGEGLPEPQQAWLASNYGAIITAIVDDRITLAYGRELLCVHRRLLDLTWCWALAPQPDEERGELLVAGMQELRQELEDSAQGLGMVPLAVRTPAIKGHQLWIEELMHWARGCRVLSAGDLGRLQILAARLERFESYYKRDGFLTRQERENLHSRLIEMNRELVAALRR